jgi:hypothetical protein
VNYAEIASALIVALPTIVTTVAGFLVAHKVVSKRRVDDVYRYALTAANAAEELMGNELVDGATKRAYAMARIQERFGLSEADAEMYLHAAVNGLRQVGAKAPKSGNPSAGTKPLAVVVTPPQPTA